MILEDDKGNIVDYFDKLPDKPIALELSGGTDSALILYCLGMTYKNKSYKSKIYPLHGYDLVRQTAISWKTAEDVTRWIKNKTQSNNIEDLYVFSYLKEDRSKQAYHRPIHDYYKIRYNISEVLMGITQAPPDMDRPNQDLLTMERIRQLADTKLPFGRVDKKFVVHQFQKLGLQELSALTVSCTEDKIGPCKDCWWCYERFWAFGSYDGEAYDF